MASHSSKRCATVKKKFVPKTKPPEPVVEYVTPGGYELEKILNRDCMEQLVFYKYHLKKLGMTHILNAAEGTWNNVDTGAEYYSDMDVVYYGVVAEDTPTFDLSQYFFSAAQFIDQTLNIPENKLLVHCVMGRSRSATLFLAYLMICKNMTVVDAVDHVKRRRRIIPNWGFLKQLRHNTSATCFGKLLREGAREI
uniref:Dual specificity protein phosphatase n=1 Tax=Oncorhynchus mykiss TaxID=8022 RepID=A0A8K9XQF2_ONCMY